MAIYADDTPVGFVMLHDEPAERKYYLWRFMIDHRFQGQGYGAQALEPGDRVRAPAARRARVSDQRRAGEGSPGPFYEKLGFAYTGEIDEAERVMRKVL